MILIEKSYYSVDSGQISIVIKDTNALSPGLMERISHVKLQKATTDINNYYTASLSNYAETADGRALFLYIEPSTDITKDDELSPDFSLNGITSIIVVIDEVELISYLYNSDEFYTYKLELYSKYELFKMNNNIEKDIVMLTFLESSMIAALSRGYIDDAQIFYLKMVEIYRLYKTIYY